MKDVTRGNPIGVRPRHTRRLLSVSAVIGAGAIVLAACGSSGGGSSSSGTTATTIPGNVTATTVAGTSAPAGTSGTGTSGTTPPTTTNTAAPPVGLYGALPPVGTPSKGGTITVGQLTGSTPTYIFPITPGAQSSVYTTYDFQNNMFLPLYSSPTGATPKINPALSVANLPTFSDGNKTVTITLKTAFKWSDGKPVTANDVVFYIDLVKQAVKESAANYNNYTAGFFPDNVKSATATSAETVTLKLTKAYNPGYFLNDQLGLLYAFPSTAWNVDAAGGAHLDYKVPANAKKIYDYLAKAGGSIATFAKNPLWQIVDGPFKVKTFSATNGSYTFVANPDYGGTPKPYASQVEFETETAITPLLNALKAGSLDVGGIDFSQLGQVDSLRSSGYSVFGYPDFGFFSAFINFKDKTDHFNSIVSQLYIRQALAHLIDQPAYLTGIYKNAGGLSYGPVPAVPVSPFTPANAIKTPYPFSVSAASQLLSSHGWKVVPHGQTTCEKAGTGPTDCGAGIPAGTPFKFTWFYLAASQSPSSGLESEAFASEAKQVGIDVELTSKTFNFLIQNYDDASPADNKYQNDWGVNNFGGFTNDTYPTTNALFNTGGDYNIGAYDSPTANKLINASVYGGNPSAVKNEASYLTANVPALFMPNGDIIYAVSKKVGGQPEGFLSATQQALFPQYWYLTK